MVSVNPLISSGGNACACGQAVVCQRASEVSLGALRSGEVAAICEARLEPQDAALLRAMGLAPASLVKVCRAGHPCIVAVVSAGADGGSWSCCSSRIGLSKELAAKLFVSRLDLSAVGHAEACPARGGP